MLNWIVYLTYRKLIKMVTNVFVCYDVNKNCITSPQYWWFCLYLYGCSRNYLIVWQKLLSVNALLFFLPYLKNSLQGVFLKSWELYKCMHDCFDVRECWQKLRKLWFVGQMLETKMIFSMWNLDVVFILSQSWI